MGEENLQNQSFKKNIERENEREMTLKVQKGSLNVFTSYLKHQYTGFNFKIKVSFGKVQKTETTETTKNFINIVNHQQTSKD